MGEVWWTRGRTFCESRKLGANRCHTTAQQSETHSMWHIFYDALRVFRLLALRFENGAEHIRLIPASGQGQDDFAIR